MSETKIVWAGIPFKDRYSSIAMADRRLLKAITDYDSRLDLKLYRPTEKWHLVRYLSADRNGKFTRVWELDDRPDIGLQREPGFWLIPALRAADMQGAAENREAEVDKINDALDASNAREMESYCQDLAADLRKPLIRLTDEGANSSHKGVF